MTARCLNEIMKYGGWLLDNGDGGWYVNSGKQRWEVWGEGTGQRGEAERGERETGRQGGWAGERVRGGVERRVGGWQRMEGRARQSRQDMKRQNGGKPTYPTHRPRFPCGPSKPAKPAFHPPLTIFIPSPHRPSTSSISTRRISTGRSKPTPTQTGPGQTRPLAHSDHSTCRPLTHPHYQTTPSLPRPPHPSSSALSTPVLLPPLLGSTRPKRPRHSICEKIKMTGHDKEK